MTLGFRASTGPVCAFRRLRGRSEGPFLPDQSPLRIAVFIYASWSMAATGPQPAAVKSLDAACLWVSGQPAAESCLVSAPVTACIANLRGYDYGLERSNRERHRGA